MDKTVTLHLESTITFGKYKSWDANVKELLEDVPHYDGLKYFLWLFNSTQYEASEEVRELMRELCARRTKERNDFIRGNPDHNHNTAIDSTDRRWEMGLGEMSSWF